MQVCFSLYRLHPYFGPKRECCHYKVHYAHLFGIDRQFVTAPRWIPIEIWLLAAGFENSTGFLAPTTTFTITGIQVLAFS